MSCVIYCFISMFKTCVDCNQTRVYFQLKKLSSKVLHDTIIIRRSDSDNERFVSQRIKDLHIIDNNHSRCFYFNTYFISSFRKEYNHFNNTHTLEYNFMKS
jgi:hypothetical protein